jgi:ubiquinone/menaquinone biosynthesis C-methylase UbiE
MARIDYDQVAAVYDTDRAVALQTQAPWRAALAGYLPPASGLPVLDLGAGTGLFAAAIAHWFDTTVIAVEPSEGMRQAARTRRADPRVAYVAGSASGCRCTTAAATAPGCPPSSTTSTTWTPPPESCAVCWVPAAGS